MVTGGFVASFLEPARFTPPGPAPGNVPLARTTEGEASDGLAPKSALRAAMATSISCNCGSNHSRKLLKKTWLNSCVAVSRLAGSTFKHARRKDSTLASAVIDAGNRAANGYCEKLSGVSWVFAKIK